MNDLSKSNITPKAFNVLFSIFIIVVLSTIAFFIVSMIEPEFIFSGKDNNSRIRIFFICFVFLLFTLIIFLPVLKILIRKTLKRANALMREGRSQEALNLHRYVLESHPKELEDVLSKTANPPTFIEKLALHLSAQEVCRGISYRHFEKPEIIAQSLVNKFQDS